MKRHATALFLLASALLTTSCLQQQQKLQQDETAATSEKPRELPPLHLGAVHQVYPDRGFALLRIIGPMPGPGATLITHPANGSNERIGNLCITAQQPSRDGFVAADIRSGVVVKGDRVFRYRNIASGGNTGDVIAVERPDVSDDTPPAGTALSEAELEAFANTPALEDEPAPLTEEPATGRVETTVLPDSVPAAPGSDPGAPATPAQTPDYLNDIPDSIDDWDSM